MSGPDGGGPAAFVFLELIFVFAGLLISWLLLLFIGRRAKKTTANLTWVQQQQKIKHDKRVVHWVVPIGFLVFALSCYGIYLMGQQR